MPEVIFTGPAGRLEGRYSSGEAEERADRHDPATAPAVSRHDEPSDRLPVLLRVRASRLSRCCVSISAASAAARARSIHGTGELSDAASALDWAQTINPEARACWVAGFSFGAWIGMQLLMRRPEVEGFISIAPPANLYDFSFLAPCPSSGLIVHGEKDAVVPPKDVNTLVEKLKTQKGIVIDQQIIPAPTTSSTASWSR
jgi:alpha/beta superfamily hydrolase